MSIARTKSRNAPQGPSPFAVEAALLPPEKFTDPDWTAKGKERASVPLVALDTLWLNTGTLCNLACAHCYIESSPTNDALVYLSRADAARFLGEAQAMGTREIGFTGGEPFMNPEFVAMLTDTLERGFEALVLSNAMKPMRRHEAALLELRDRFGGRLTIRVSLDHHTKAVHEAELVSPLTAHHVGAQQHVPGGRLAGEGGEPTHGPLVDHEAQLGGGHPEPRARGRRAQVAGDGELGAGAEREPLDHREGRHRRRRSLLLLCTIARH